MLHAHIVSIKQTKTNRGMGRQKQAHTQNKPCTDVPNHASHPTNWADKFLHETIWKKKGTVSFLGQQAEGGLPRATLTAILLRFPASQNAVLTQRVSCLEHSSKNAAFAVSPRLLHRFKPKHAVSAKAQVLPVYATSAQTHKAKVTRLNFTMCY